MLEIVDQLVQRMIAEEILFCHWKSNNRVREAVEGLTDLDLLVERSDAAKLVQIFGALGFKQFPPRISRQYPGVEDHLAVDPRTGRLVHVHLYYQLIVGEKHLKGYRLPWERTVLESRVWDDDAGIYVAEPAMELLLLIVRAAMKHRLRDWAKSVVQSGNRPGWYDEFDWLISRPGVDADSVRERGTVLLGEETARQVAQIVQRYKEERRPVRPGELRALRRALREYRRYLPLGGFVWGSLRQVHWAIGVVNQKWLRWPVSLRRGVAHGGFVVAFVGSDGSGKSTVVRHVHKLFSSKIDVTTLYFGSGDGPSSLVRRPLKWANTLRRRRSVKGGGKEKDKPEQSTADRSLLFLAARTLWAVLVAQEKRKNLKRLWRARNRGVLVLCDRFPQTQTMGFNDGPLLSAWRTHPCTLIRRLAQWEYGVYKKANRLVPDLVIKLRVPPHVAVTRKPEMTIEETERRERAVAELQFPSSTAVEVVNTDVELERVLATVVAAIWRRL